MRPTGDTRSSTGAPRRVVDDGIAMGSTARAACEMARADGARRVVLAVPVTPQDWTTRPAGAAHEFVCVDTPEPFFGVGQFYADFSQTTDDGVIACLHGTVPAGAGGRRCRRRSAGARRRRRHPGRDGAGERHLTVPETANGVVAFAHASSSSRHSPRNRYVASTVNAAGVASLAPPTC